MKVCDNGYRNEGLSIYIADDGPDTCEFLKKTVETGQGWRVAGISRCYEDFISEAPEADAWLISSAFLGLTPPEKLSRALAENPRTIILAVTDSGDYAEIKAALRRGARDVVVCDGSHEETRGLIHAHYYENRQRLNLLEKQLLLSAEETQLAEENTITSDRGHTAMITGADGGTGKSFIAAQLAGLTAKHGRAKTCLLDLDLKYGALGSVLGVSGKAKRALVDLTEVADELEPGHIESILFAHECGFYFVPATLSHQPACTAEIPIAKVVNILRGLFDVVICDMPAALWNEGLEHEADSAYIVISPDRVSAECAARLAVQMRKGELIVNMCDKKGAIPAIRLAETTGLELAADIPEDAGAGKLFEAGGEILAERVNLAIVRSLVPIAQRCSDFDELVPEQRISIFRKGAQWIRQTPPS